MEKKRRIKERRERREKDLKEGLFKVDRMGTGGEGKDRQEGHFGHVPRGGGIQRELDFEEERAAGVSGGKAWLHRILRRFHLMSPLQSALPFSDLRFAHIGRSINSNSDNSRNEGDDVGGLKMQRTITQNSIVKEKGYESFRKQIQKEQSREFQLKIGIAMSLFWIFWLVSSFFFLFLFLESGWEERADRDLFDAFR